MRPLPLIAAALLCSVPLAGCVVYEPVPAYRVDQPSFERSFNASLGALQDTGVQVTSADPATGLIRGTRDGIDVSVFVIRQADASIRVQFDVKGDTQRDPGLSNRISQAYERRMGR